MYDLPHRDITFLDIYRYISYLVCKFFLGNCLDIEISFLKFTFLLDIDHNMYNLPYRDILDIYLNNSYSFYKFFLGNCLDISFLKFTYLLDIEQDDTLVFLSL